MAAQELEESRLSNESRTVRETEKLSCNFLCDGYQQSGHESDNASNLEVHRLTLRRTLVAKCEEASCPEPKPNQNLSHRGKLNAHQSLILGCMVHSSSGKRYHLRLKLLNTGYRARRGGRSCFAELTR